MERRALVRAALALPRVAAGLRLYSFQRMTRHLERRPTAPTLPFPSEAQWERARAAAWAIRALDRRVAWETRCLVQALAAQRLCPEIPGAVVLGVARGGGGGSALNAHAWWLCGDEVLLGGESSERFTPIGVLVWGLAPHA